MRPSTALPARIDSRVVRVDVDGDELVLVLVERDLERVEDEADVRFVLDPLKIALYEYEHELIPIDIDPHDA